MKKIIVFLVTAIVIVYGAIAITYFFDGTQAEPDDYMILEYRLVDKDGNIIPNGSGNPITVSQKIGLYYNSVTDQNETKKNTTKLKNASIFDYDGFEMISWEIDGLGYRPGTYLRAGLTKPASGKIEVEPSWIQKQYTVQFDSHGGINPAKETIWFNDKFGQFITSNSFIKKADHAFVGWYTSPTDGIEVTADTVFSDLMLNLVDAKTNTITLHAHWLRDNSGDPILEEYILIFDPNGGTGGNGSQIFTQGVTKLLNGGIPVREGYTFKCWNLNIDGSGKNYYNGLSTLLEGSNTVYAQWTPIPSVETYTVTFNTNGGVGGNTSQTFTEGEWKPLDGGIPTRVGYNFICWNLKADGTGADYYNGVNTKLEGNNTLYAKWAETAATTYTLTFDPNGGVGGNGYQSFEPGVARIIDGGIPTRSGYTFVCWNLKADGTGIDYYNGLSTILEGNNTVYAKWAAVYTITFDPNGGTGGNGSQVFGIGEMKPLNGGVPTRAGYTFVCWNTKADGTGLNFYNNVNTTAEGSNVLYAKWVPIGPTTYVVTFDPNGGTGGNGTQTFIEGVSQKLNGGVPTRAGYTFVCWTLYPDGSGGDFYNGVSTTLEGSNVIYAKWVPIGPTTYVVTFDPNGGTGGNGTQTFIEGVSQKLNGGVPTRAGYTFVCWTLYPDGSGGDFYNGVSTTLEGSNVIYAKWSKN